MQHQKIISARNISTVDGASYVVWMNVLPDGKIHAKLCKAIDMFAREPWYIDNVFENKETAMDGCCKAIEANDSLVQKISKERQGTI